MGFFVPSVMEGGGGGGWHHNFVVIALMILKFGTGMKLDIFDTMVSKKVFDIQILGNYDVITNI